MWRWFDWLIDFLRTRRGRIAFWLFAAALGAWATFSWLVQGDDFSDEWRIVHPIQGPILVLLSLFSLLRTFTGRDDPPDSN
jgi:hypothetical protein